MLFIDDKNPRLITPGMFVLFENMGLPTGAFEPSVGATANAAATIGTHV